MIKRDLFPPLTGWSAIPTIIFTAVMMGCLSALPAWAFCKVVLDGAWAAWVPAFVGLAVTVALVAIDITRRQVDLGHRIAALEKRAGD